MLRRAAPVFGCPHWSRDRESPQALASSTASRNMSPALATVSCKAVSQVVGKAMSVEAEGACGNAAGRGDKTVADRLNSRSRRDDV